MCLKASGKKYKYLLDDKNILAGLGQESMS